MKEKAFSLEWALAYKEKINENEEYLKLASTWNDSLILETIEHEENIGVHLVLENGICKSAKIAEAADYENSSYVINAKIDVWKNLLDGTIDPILAIMMKKLLLTKGSLTDILKYANAAKELLKTAKKIETYF